MKRRQLVAVGLAAPWTAVAQPTPVIGFLCSGSPAQWTALLAAFREGLGAAGYVEGRNLSVEFAWALGQEARLPALAANLVHRGVDVLVATGGPAAALAAQAATSRVPIVFTLGADPVQVGLVQSLARPGGHITGVTFITGDLHAKRLELLNEAVPSSRMIGMLANPDNPRTPPNIAAVQAAARTLGQRVEVVFARTADEIERGFATLVGLKVRALLAGSDAFFFERREQFVAGVVRHRLPACFDLREFAVAGALMSYGASLAAVYREAGSYTGRILGGARPGELPVQQPTKLELVLNLKAAGTLGLAIAQPLRLRADEVIE